MLISGNESILALNFDVHGRASHEDAEVAQVYVGDSPAPVPRPPKELKGFAKVELRPGETKQVVLTLDRRAFSLFDVRKHDWTAESGDFTILVGSSSADIKLRQTFKLDLK
jgi:beta-glucosidase